MVYVTNDVTIIEGVIDLHLTLGERETKAFQQNQNQLKSAKLPYFECLQEDLSGGMNLEMYLWKMEGTGKDCLTKLIIDLKPPYLSNEGMRSRQENLYSNQFIKLIWHPSIHFEIQAYRSMKMGQAEFAIQELSICTNPLVSYAISLLYFIKFICVIIIRNMITIISMVIC